MILLFLLFYALTICCAAKEAFGAVKTCSTPRHRALWLGVLEQHGSNPFAAVGGSKAPVGSLPLAHRPRQWSLTRPNRSIPTSFKCGSAAGRLAVSHSGGVAFLQLQLRGGR